MNPSARGNRGFTLIESMISLGVLAVGLSATAPLLMRSMDSGGSARKLTIAQQIAQDMIDRLRAEIRYDGDDASPITLAPADAWKFDALPHAPSVGGAGAGCQPAGQDDGIAYDYGPFVFRREQQSYTVCYGLTVVDPNDPQRGNLPNRSMDARVRVLWNSGAGGAVSSWSLSDLLVKGE